MLKKLHDIRNFQHLMTILAVVVTVLLFFSCKDKSEGLVAFSYDAESIPSLVTDSAFQLVSDSCITRYKMVYDVWMVFDKAKEPYWFFPEGLYVEQFTPDFEIESTVEADTAWYYMDKDLLRLKKNVHVENIKGEKFDSDELFWDRKNARVYSDAYIEIQQGESRLSGYGFESNQQMTDYRIFRPRDGRFPFVDQPVVAEGDSLDVDLMGAPDASTPDSLGMAPVRTTDRDTLDASATQQEGGT